jgi:hypothetical protein
MLQQNYQKEFYGIKRRGNKRRCVDCGNLYNVNIKDTKSNRCKNCYNIYRSNQKNITQNIRREKLKSDQNTNKS